MIIENTKHKMQYFEKQYVKLVLEYLSNQKGIRMTSISQATGIPLGTIKNIKSGRSGKKEYFDRILEVYPEAIQAISDGTPPTSPTTPDKEAFNKAQVNITKLEEIQMKRELRALIKDMEMAPNKSEEELEVLRDSYEVLGLPIPERFRKK